MTMRNSCNLKIIFVYNVARIFFLNNLYNEIVPLKNFFQLIHITNMTYCRTFEPAKGRRGTTITGMLVETCGTIKVIRKPPANFIDQLIIVLKCFVIARKKP